MKLRYLAVAILMVAAINSTVFAGKKEMTSGQYGQVLQALVEVAGKLGIKNFIHHLDDESIKATLTAEFQGDTTESLEELKAAISNVDNPDFRKTATAWYNWLEEKATNDED